MSPETAGGVTGGVGEAGDDRAVEGSAGRPADGGGVGRPAGGGGFATGLAQATSQAMAMSERWRARIVGSLAGVGGRLNRNRPRRGVDFQEPFPYIRALL